MNKAWDKKYSGPHMCWVITYNGRRVCYQTRLPGDIEAAVARVQERMGPGEGRFGFSRVGGGSPPPLLVGSEEDADLILAELRRTPATASR